MPIFLLMSNNNRLVKATAVSSSDRGSKLIKTYLQHIKTKTNIVFIFFQNNTAVLY